MAKHAEGALTEQVVAWLKAKKAGGTPLCWEHRSGSGGFAYKQGIPDLFVVCGRYHIEVELKAPGGRRSPMQDKRRGIFLKMGTPYVCPTTLAEFAEFMEPWCKLAEAELEG